jgi:hypothetical protein
MYSPFQLAREEKELTKGGFTALEAAVTWALIPNTTAPSGGITKKYFGSLAAVLFFSITSAP